jgi:NAD(P)-dependent dehydrogenase (short-subunit alcohol dehydrogenase family)
MIPAANPHKTALVTGAARRIGRTIALDLARAGWATAVHYRRSAEEANDLVAEIERQGGQAKAFAADLADDRDVEKLTDSVAKVFGPITVLVNNASEFLPDSVETLETKTWNLHQSINLKAPVFLARLLARQLPDKAEGNIINIIDQRVWNLTPDFFSYTISKSGLWTATRTLALALAPKVRVNAIAPGPVLQSTHQTEEEFAREAKTTLLGRGPSVEEIAAAVRFILATPSLTGQMIALDGGQHLTRVIGNPE